MKAMNTSFILAVAASVFASASVFAKDLVLTDCPPAVQETIKNNSRDGKVDYIKSMNVEGRALFIAAVDLANDADLKIHVSNDGKLLKTREDLRFTDVPAAVQEAARKLIPAGGKIDEVDKEVADGKATFEIEITRPNAPELEVVFAADGAIISQKEDLSD